MLDRLDKAIAQSLADKEVAAKLAEQGMVVGGGPASPADFKTFVNKEYEKYGRITKELGLSKQQ